jgi:acylphosphatase
VTKARAHVFIEGMVQGVFFRSYTQDQAERSNVTGWVRNLRNGRVEAVFEGEEEDVQAVVDLCRKGPPGAHVSNMKVDWQEHRGEFESFEIKYF